MKADFHMHTNFSSDATSTPEEMIEGAIQKGLKTICITDHQDVDWPDCESGENFQIDFEHYIPTIQRLQAQYKDRIEILLGVEFGLQPHLANVYKETAAKYPFDFIIGSVHILDGLDPYRGTYFANMTDTEGYRRALELTMENIKNIEDFDSLGHLDYVVRYAKEKEGSYRPLDYMDMIDEVLRLLIEKQKGLEINTAGWKYGLSFAHPHMEILRRYRELGGEIITVGSDGHRPEHIAYDFHKVSPMLKDCGFKFYTEFRKREPLFMELP